VGFAIGLERLVLLLEALRPGTPEADADVFVMAPGEGGGIAAISLAEQLRDALPALRIVYNCGGGSFKSQFRKADKSGARLALILGEEEVANG
ncbi:His/Gly/Thr/Pro-type tRNA ligase C-terminal domain-containing protein, partial [Acinetobacter baumannii]